MTALPADPAYVAFLRAAHAAPDDDTPRLVLADWLDERAGGVACPRCDGDGVMRVTGLGVNLKCDGSQCPGCRGTGRAPDGLAARAEFIRVQCELARIQRGALTPGGRYVDFDDGYDALRRRERELLQPNWRAWMPDSPELFACGNRDCFPCAELTEPDRFVIMTFRRGFVASVRGPLDALWRPCERCRGRGEVDEKNYHGCWETHGCPACAGRGHAGALAALGPEVLAVRSCEVTDKRASRRPLNGDYPENPGWRWWWSEEAEAMEDELPEPFYSLVRGHHASPDLAAAALGAAVLKSAQAPYLGG